MEKRKVLFLIPDGVGIRNYLYSDVVKHLKEKNSEIAFWSTLPKEAFEQVEELHNIKIQYKQIILNSENILVRLFKEAATFARLTYNSKKVNNPSLLCNWRKNNKSFKLRQLYKFAEIIGKRASKDYDKILWLEQKSKIFWSRVIIDNYKKDLQALNLSSIFITHQRVAGLMPICIAAQELGIKINTAIYSWDNLPKARMAVLADNYFVWSDYMKAEVAVYYPEINPENVIVTGTPQFEFYDQKERIINRREFATKYNLDFDKKWICFSGDDALTSPYDADYLRDVASEVSLKSSDYHIIFRRSPVDGSNRYDNVIEEFKHLITPITPIWYTNEKGWGSFLPALEDVSLLGNMAYHCFVAINVGSTIAHDFSVFDKPCIYINYDQVFAEKWSVKTIYNFQHFKSMNGLDAVVFLNNKNEWLEKINDIAIDSQLIATDRHQWREKIILHPLNLSSRLIAEELIKYS